MWRPYFQISIFSLVVFSISILGCGNSEKSNEPEVSNNSNFPIVTEELAVYKTQDECEQIGGKWGTHTNSTEPSCKYAMSDAGNPCSDSSHCLSHCEAPENYDPDDYVIGSCNEFNISPACWFEVSDGSVYGEYCA